MDDSFKQLDELQQGVYLDKNKKVVYKTQGSYPPHKTHMLQKEFDNYTRLHARNLEGAIRFPIATYKKKENVLVLEYINGETLRDADFSLVERFGRSLHQLHEQGITHGHLELQDIIFYNETFYLVDLGFIGERTPLEDYAWLKLSIYVQQLKNPRKWRQFTKKGEALRKGYTHSFQEARQVLLVQTWKSIRYLLKQSPVNIFKATGIIILIIPRILLYKQ